MLTVALTLTLTPTLTLSLTLSLTPPLGAGDAGGPRAPLARRAAEHDQEARQQQRYLVITPSVT